MSARPSPWLFPYRSTRKPVLAANMVCSSQPLAAQAGLQMLKAGGNAVDAALAAAITLTVVEPVMNGIGGDVFALIWDGTRLQGLNATGRAPAAWTLDHFQGQDRMPLLGWDTVTVPGAVSAWADLSERYGKLAFGTLFEPAIHYAADGYYVSPIIARQWADQVDTLVSQPGFAQAFLHDGKAPGAGELWRFPAQARTLERIAQTRGRDFYEGELADRIIAFSRETGGSMSHADLASHKNEWVDALQVSYRGDYLVHELPPNGQGIAALMALGMLDTFDPPRREIDALHSFHLPIEALKLAFADLHEYVGDPAGMGSLVTDLLDPVYLRQRAALISLKEARDHAAGLPQSHGTVYLTAADSSGMMVSFIQSNYKGFGSGIVIPDTGISMHNRGRDFSLVPGHRNQVRPGRRPLHTLIPGFITRQGQPFASFGVMGGSMQAQGHVQVVQQLIDLQYNPQTAIDAPRFRVEPGPQVMLEAAVPQQVAGALATMGHVVRPQPLDSLDFGSGQAIQRLDHGGYAAGSDPRRDGLAVGY